MDVYFHCEFPECMVDVVSLQFCATDSQQVCDVICFSVYSDFICFAYLIFNKHGFFRRYRIRGEITKLILIFKSLIFHFKMCLFLWGNVNYPYLCRTACLCLFVLYKGVHEGLKSN